MYGGKALAALIVALALAHAAAETGDNCATPLVINVPAGLPFVGSNDTCGRGNDYTGDNTCLGPFAAGEDIIYALQVNEAAEIKIVMDPHGQNGTALVLSNNCPPFGEGCLAGYFNETNEPRVLDCMYLAPGTYTLMIDGLGACVTSFDLSISACELPHGACCVNLECSGTMSQAQCSASAGLWYPGFDCATFPCPIILSDWPDTCGTAYEIPAIPCSVSVNNYMASAGPPAGSCNDPNAPGLTVMQNDIWFRYTPTQAGTLTMSVQYYYNGLTAVYSGSGCAALNALTCLNAGGPGAPDLDAASIDVSPGTTYWFQIGDYGSSPCGGATLLVLTDPVTILTGDVNCSGNVGFDDINPFVLLLSNPTAWQATFPGCPVLNGDINGDGSANFDDINPFVALLSGYRGP